ncbi:MAG: type II toxin-antitoxin system VapC family toxin [Candidatus Bathyarchaeia archaeon]
MLLESDIFIAYLKKEDWLKETATKIIKAIEDGRLQAGASSEIFHELYYVFSEYAPLSVILADAAKISTIRNLSFVDADYSVYLTALSLLETYNMKSIFDAIYAATALSGKVPDHIIVSTDRLYDRIHGIERVDPRQLDI